MRPYTDREWESLPHVVMTSDVSWDPSTLDGEFPSVALNADDNAITNYNNGTAFDAYGNYKFGTIVASAHVLRDHPVLATPVLPDKPVDTLVVTTPPLVTTNPAPLDPIDDDATKHGPTTNLDDPTATWEKASTTFTMVSPQTVPSKLDPVALQQYFAFLPTKVVAKTLEKTTQYARVHIHDTFKRCAHT